MHPSTQDVTAPAGALGSTAITTRPTGRVSRARRGARGRRSRLFRHELRRLLALAGPIVVSQLGTVGMNTIDTLMVGPLGAASLASVAVGSAIQSTMLVICTGVVLGMTPLISQATGAGDAGTARTVLVQGLWLALALSVPLVVVTFFGGAITRALGQAPEVVALAGGYMRALAPGLPAAMLFMAFRQFLEGKGLTRPTMIITLVGLGLNAVLNYTMVYGVDGLIPPLGAVGVGVTTSAVRWAMLFLMLGFLARHAELRPFDGVRWRMDGARVRRIVAIGAPIGGQMGMEMGIFAFATVMMGWFGAVELAAHQVALNITSTTFMIALGVSLAGSIRVGHHIGARNRHGVHRSTFATYILTFGFMGACALVFVVVPGALVRLYTTDPAIVALGASLLVLAGLFQLFDGAQVAGINVLRGAADTRVPMLMAAAGYWGIGLPTAYILGFHSPLGPRGIWIGLATSLGVVAVLLVARVRRVLLAPRDARQVMARS